MPHLELTYFDIKARAEAIRLVLTIGGIPFTDKRVSFDEFKELKASGQLPFGSAPVLSIDGKIVSQSLALARYCAKLADLYPKSDDLLALEIDEFIDGINDGLTGVRKSGELKDRQDWVANGFPRYFGALETIAKKNTHSTSWVCGPHISLADVVLYVTVGTLNDGVFDHVPENLFKDYPRLLASFNAVNSHPKVVEWNKAHPWKKPVA